MKLKYVKKPIKKGVLLVPVFSEYLSKTPSFIPKEVKEFAKSRAKQNMFEAKNKQSLTTYPSSNDLADILVVQGAGEKSEMKSANALELGGRLGKQLKASKQADATLLLTADFMPFVGEIMEGLHAVQYDIGIAKSEKKEADLKNLNLLFELSDKSIKADVDYAMEISEARSFVKDLVNSPANIIDAAAMVENAKKVAKANKLKITVFNQKKLEKMKAGGILAVNQGCAKDANLIMLEYYGAKSKSEKPHVLVGKGVIFDTGGYNLKPTGYMETMHHDMAGAATVLGVMSMLKKLGVKKNVIALLPCVENLINEDAYRPSDIVTMLSGKTVEVTNTDAEGRMILADALFYGSQIEPASMLSIATLTGAVEVALGHRYAGVMGNDQELINKMISAGNEVDELAWQLPIHDDYREEMKSEFADIKNHNRGSRGAGTAKAAAFLENFVEQTPWVHIDIGGTAWTKAPKAYQTKYATAHGLKLILEYLMR